MPLYVRDWLASPTRIEMTLAERAGYLELLFYQWDEGSVPADPVKLAARLGVSVEEWLTVAPKILAQFRLRNGRLKNKVCSILRRSFLDRSRTLSERGRRGGKAQRVFQLERNPHIPMHETGSVKGNDIMDLPRLAKARASECVSVSVSLGDSKEEKKGRKTESYDPGPGWLRFKREYPHIRSEQRALHAWLSVCESAETEAAICAGLAVWQKSDEWARGVFTDAARWLMDHMWAAKPAPIHRDETELERLRRIGI